MRRDDVIFVLCILRRWYCPFISSFGIVAAISSKQCRTWICFVILSPLQHLHLHRSISFLLPPGTLMRLPFRKECCAASTCWPLHARIRSAITVDAFVCPGILISAGPACGGPRHHASLKTRAAHLYHYESKLQVVSMPRCIVVVHCILFPSIPDVLSACAASQQVQSCVAVVDVSEMVCGRC